MSDYLRQTNIGNMTTSQNGREMNYFLIPLFIAFLLFMRPSFAQVSGEDLFKQNCAVCHTTTDQKLIGPGLANISSKRTQKWLISWIRNSQELIASGDADAIAIFEEYNKIPMIPYPQYSDKQIISILDYIKEVGDATNK